MAFGFKILTLAVVLAFAPLAFGGEAKMLPGTQAQVQLSFAPLVRQTASSVVNVYAEKRVEHRPLYDGDPFFEQFFGQQMPNRTQKQSSLGSGVIIDAKGLIITNNHVIDGAGNIRIALTDGREFSTKVVLKDDRLDLAVLQIEDGGPFAALPVGDSDVVEVGDLVLAIGNPFGVGQTVTSGIVSGLARSRVGQGDFGFFIQTDASINPGNSGGALINMKGELIGINSAILSRGGGSNGVGFSIPSNLVRVFIAAAQGGQPGFQRPFIGATFSPVTTEISDNLGLKAARGALVAKIIPDSPAAMAGLQVGDVVLAVNGIAVEHPDALDYRLTTVGLGAVARLTVSANGQERELTMTLTQAPELRPRDERLIEGRNPFAGALVANLSPRLSEELRLPLESVGVVIIDITRGSPAARLGLETRDIIININGDDIDSTEELQSTVEKESELWRVEIERNGQRVRQFIR